MGSVNLGPFAFPVALLVLLGAAMAGIGIAKWKQRGRPLDVEPFIWRALIAGALAARLAFVARYADAYRSAPWSAFDIRDGGFIAPAGLIAALAVLAWYGWRTREARTPLLLSALAGITVWVLGVAATMVFYTGPTAMPPLTLARLDGSSVPLQSLAGKPMVVNLWATWCPPCRREMPVLRDAQAQHPEVVFVFANQGESADAVRSYLDTQHLALANVLLDTRLQLGIQTGSRALPTTLFFNEKGMLVDRRIGGLSAATLAQRLESLRTAH